MAATLSEYQCECAAPSAVQTPQTYKQGPVVRLDKDVREVQKWAGVDQGGSMNRESRTALRDKVAEYQRQNGIEAKTPGELNKDTLDRMRQDKALPGGLVDSLEKVNPYYKPDGLPRITCVTKPGEEVKPVAKTEAPKVAEKPSLDKMGIINQDVPPEKEAQFYADMSKKYAEMVQEKCKLPKTGKFDEETLNKIKEDPQFKNLSPQIDKWKSAGLIDKDGNWDQKRHAELRVESWGKPSAPAAESGIANAPGAKPQDFKVDRAISDNLSRPGAKADNPFAGSTFKAPETSIIQGPYRLGIDPAPEIIRGPADMSKPQGTSMKLTAADGYTEGWQRFKAEYITPLFKEARENQGPQSLEVMARMAQAEVAAPAAEGTKVVTRQQFGIT